MRYICQRFFHFAFKIWFVSSIFVGQKEYALSLINMPVMMVFILGCFFLKVLTFFITPTAISLLILIHIISTARYNHKQCYVWQRNIPGFLKAFSTESPLIPKLSPFLKLSLQTYPYLLKPATTKSPMIMTRVVQFFRSFSCCVSYYLSLRGTRDQQILTKLLPVKLQAILFMGSIYDLYKLP